MTETKEKGFFNSITGKVLMAFLMGAVAVVLSWVVTRVGFKEMLFTVDKLSKPNEKLRLVNDLFQELTLAQSQQLQSFQKTEKAEAVYQAKSKELFEKLDSLGKQNVSNEWQLQKIDSMQQLLHTRDTIFQAYLALRADFAKNQALSQRINTVSQLIAQSKPLVDSSVVTNRQKITTTTTFPTDSIPADIAKKPKQSFFSRLFGSRKNELMLPALKQVEQELKVQVDTLSVAKQYGALRKIEKVMRQMEADQHQRTTQLFNRELALLQASNQLHHQLLSVLHSIEAQELEQVKKDSGLATEVVNDSVSRINYIMLGFFLIMAVLLFLILLDISRSHRYRKQLIAAKEEAEHLGRVKQRFLANMSHEIRTPLQSIIGYSEQLREQNAYSPQAVEAIYQSSEHLLHIVNEVLDYSRITSGKFVFEQKPFELRQLVTEVAESMRLAAEKKQLQFTVELYVPKACSCLGDAFRLRQVLYNLLSNAIKFTERGTVQLRVRVEEVGERVNATFIVKDSGIGIAAQDLDRVFHAFEQAELPSENIQVGTGLGLSIVKGLIEAQGGEIFVSSVPQKGSEFTVQLTYEQVQPASVSQDTLLAAISAPAVQPLLGEVLVVDDDAFILQLCDRILLKHQVEHVCTSDAIEVLEKEWGNDLKLVLMDIRMPVLNGFELCRLLRHKLGPAVPIFALTAQALPEERDSILQKGFDGILMKPFKEQELMYLVQEYLQAAVHQPETSTLMLAEEGEEMMEAAVALDLQPLQKMVGGDEQLLKDILAQFLEDTQADITDLEIVIQERDMAEAEEILHKLASRAGQVGAQQLSNQLRQKERILAQQQMLNQDWDDIQVLRQNVISLNKLVEQQLTPISGSKTAVV